MPSSNGCVSNSCCGYRRTRYSSLPQTSGFSSSTKRCFALFGQPALGFEPVGFRLPVLFMDRLFRNHQFERDRPPALSPPRQNADFQAQSIAEGDAFLRDVQPSHRHFRPDFAHPLLPLRQAARRLEIGFRVSAGPAGFAGR